MPIGRTEQLSKSPIYEGYGEMAQKVIEWDMSHVKKMAQNPGHVSFCCSLFQSKNNRDCSKFEKNMNSRNKMLRILSYLVFLAWKVSHLSEKTRDRYFEPSRFLMHITSCETCLLRWLFEPSHHSSRIKQLFGIEQKSLKSIRFILLKAQLSADFTRMNLAIEPSAQ